MSEEAPPIFIGGLNRSGTSMVRQILGSHSAVAIPPSEFEFLKRIRVRPRARLGEAQVAELVDRVLSWPKVSEWEVDRDAVLHLALGEPTHRGIFVAFLRSYADQRSKPLFGDKTTSYERHLAVLDRWFAHRYTFVHLVRHPVATFASARWYRGVQSPIDPHVWSRTWNGSVLAALRRLRARSPGYVLLRYEDVVSDPGLAMAAVCDAAHLEFEPRMLEMGDFARRENSSFELVEAEYVGSVRRLDGVVRAERLSASELNVVRAQCRVLARLLGYDVDDERAIVPFAVGRSSAAIGFRMAFATTSTAHRARHVPARLVTVWRTRARAHA
ncbi:MAG: sulfotransferase family protein [Gaiellaceae bacterium]